jgi:hypothetical protein
METKAHFHRFYTLCSRWLKIKALLKLRVVIGLPAALPPAAEKAFSSPSLASGRIFPLSFSAGVLKNHLGTGFYLGPFLIQPAGFLYGRIKTKRKPADACGRRRLEDPAGRKSEEAGNLLHGKPAGLKRSFLIYINNSFNTA